MPGNFIGKQRNSRTIWYGLITTVLFAAVSLLQWVNKTSVDSYFFLALLLAFLLGMIHVKLMYRYINFVIPGKFGEGLLVTIILMALAAIASAVIYYFLKLNYVFITFILPFIVPYICWQTYRYFLQIPASEYKLWYYPVDLPEPDIGAIDLSQILVVQFVFTRNPNDLSKTNFTARAPLNLSLGELFFIFIYDYNGGEPQSPIVFLNSRNLPYGWLFYRKRGWFRKRKLFDPGLSFKDNLINSNEFIYADRITK